MIFLLAWIFRQPLVWLVDHDGTLSLRWARRAGNRHVWARRHGFDIRTVFLEPGGKVRNGSYVTSWEPANTPAARLFGKEEA